MGQFVWAVTSFLAMVTLARTMQAQTSTPSPQRQTFHLQQLQTPSRLWPTLNLPLGSEPPSLAIALPNSSVGSPSLFDPADSYTKFKLDRLMSILRDNRHEGWVRTAYPDPKTGRPLIGGGFSLDLSEAVHVQRDPFNPTAFIEPSSAQLWQAAGLDSAKLNAILDQFYRRQIVWGTTTFRRKIRMHELSPDITEEEALHLLRISALQAIHNARAYCADFDKMNAWQQMALSQLVFQMGVNLEEFVAFLGAINGYAGDANRVQTTGSIETVDWKAVQSTLVHSDWARRYTVRAVSVIAMFDPNYDIGPSRAERRIRVWIHPLPSHHRRRREFAGGSPRQVLRRRTKQS